MSRDYAVTRLRQGFRLRPLATPDKSPWQASRRGKQVAVATRLRFQLPASPCGLRRDKSPWQAWKAG